MKLIKNHKLLIYLSIIFSLYINCTEAGSKTIVEQNNTVAIKDSIPKKTERDTITINAVGDVMFGSNFPDSSEMPENMGKNLLKPFENYLKDSDINFANSEGTFLNRGGIPKGLGNQVFCFRQPSEMAKNYVDYNFNLLSIANNHISDFGERGISSTDSVLTALNIAFAGSLSKPITSIKVRSTTIGFAAFAPHKGCVNMNDIENAITTVKKLKSENDIVIVSFHGGAEGDKHQHVTRKTEFFYKQNRGNVYDFAHQMIDAGADVVIGHGPHVVRAVELYHEKFIAYSLGNFCTYGMFNLKGVSGNAPLLKLKIDNRGNFMSAKIISGKQLGEGGPILDEQEKTAFNKIAELSKTDFPESELSFVDGTIEKK